MSVNVPWLLIWFECLGIHRRRFEWLFAFNESKNRAHRSRSQMQRRASFVVDRINVRIKCTQNRQRFHSTFQLQCALAFNYFVLFLKMWNCFTKTIYFFKKKQPSCSQVGSSKRKITNELAAVLPCIVTRRPIQIVDAINVGVVIDLRIYWQHASSKQTFDF